MEREDFRSDRSGHFEREDAEWPSSPMPKEDELLSEAEKKLVNNVLDKQEAALEKQLKSIAVRDYRWYMNNGLEQEAYPGGLLAFLLANANDVNKPKHGQH